MTAEPEQAPVCYRHLDRPTYITCQRCGRPICPDCMVSASVGFQCPTCVKEGAKQTRAGRTAYGGMRPDRPGQITYALIGINVLIWLAIAVTGGGGGQVLAWLGLSPVGETYLVNGQPTFVRGVADGAVWQLLTSMFTQVQIWHLAFNMYALMVLGPTLEVTFGRLRYALLYLVSGLAGSTGVYLLSDPHSLTVGASGAIFGLMATFLVVALKSRGNVQAVVTLIAINAVITVLGSAFISWQGHLGGFLGGLLAGGAMVYAPKKHRSAYQFAAVGVLLAACAVAIVLRTGALN